MKKKRRIAPVHEGSGNDIALLPSLLPRTYNNDAALQFLRAEVVVTLTPLLDSFSFPSL